MKINLSCNIETLNDAIAMGQIHIICEIFKKFKEHLKDGGKVSIFEDFAPSITYREELQFDNENDFTKWTKTRFPLIECGD